MRIQQRKDHTSGVKIAGLENAGQEYARPEMQYRNLKYILNMVASENPSKKRLHSIQEA